MSPPRTRFQQLHADVFAEIVGGHQKPGDRIAIKDLADKLKVSTTPLREILSRLVGRGLLEERRSQGYYITRLDARDIADLLDLHGACVERALTLSSRYLEDITAAATPWDLFEIIVSATDNVALIEVQEYIADRLSLLRPFEEALVGPPAAELARLKAGVAAQGSTAEMREFHEIRKQLAGEFALKLNRRTGH